MSRLIPLFLAAAALICAACSKEEHKKRFGWLKGGNRLHYDYYGPADTIRDYSYLEVSGSKDELRFREFAVNAPSIFRVWCRSILQRDMQIKRGGLYGMACNDCRIGPFSCSTQFDFLYAPNAPFLNQELPTYSCGSDADDANYIVNNDTTLTVPMGTFRTYIMKHPTGDKSYWSPEHGLIMYEIHDRYLPAGTLRLNRITH